MLTGKGMWIWKISQACEGDVGEIVAKAQRAGLSYVLIKAVATTRGLHRYNSQQLGDLVWALREADIIPMLWGYHTCEMDVLEAELAASVIHDYHVDWYVVDAEVEVENHPEDVRKFLRHLRCRLLSGARAKTRIGLSSYYLPHRHASVPWREFARQVDFVMPQVYWYSHDPKWALAESIRQYRDVGFWDDIPLIPTGAAYWAGMGAPTEDKQSEAIKKFEVFLQACDDTKLLGANFWSWDACPGGVWRRIRDWRPRADE